MKTPYDRKFFGTYRDISRSSAAAILPLVFDLVPVKSVCDVGCGIGTWLSACEALGVERVYGIDGDYVDRAQMLIDPTSFHPQNLAQEIHVDQQFDLAMCMEVAEHLPGDRANSLIEDLTRLAPVVLFSAAVPMQGGTDHVNEQWQDYWAALFSRNGFDVFDVVRPRVWNDERIARWYRQNTLLYCHRDSVSRFPRLTSAATKLPLAVVHPKQFVEGRDEIDTWTALQLARRAVARGFQRRLARFGLRWRPAGPHFIGICELEPPTER